MNRSGGLKQTFLVTLDDGDAHKITSGPRDVIRWEAVHRRGFFDNDRPSFSMLAWLAWHALNRSGEYAGDFTAFSDAVTDLDVIDDSAGATVDSDATADDNFPT